MIRLFALFTLLVMLTTSSCSILEQAQEYERFIQCEFSLNSIEILEVGGVEVSAFEKPSEIGMLTMMSLTQQLLSGTMPAKMSISLNAKNNNAAKASIMGMDWQLFVKENQLLNGEVNRYVEVQPGSVTVFPITTTIDILKIIESKSLDQVLNFVFSNNKEKELGELGLAVKIRPHYKVGSEIRKSPAYLTISL